MTVSLPLDLSQTMLPRQIQGNMIAYMKLFAGLPDMVMRDDEVFWFISHRPAPGNAIFRFNGQTEQHIDEVFAEIGQHIDEISWMVFPVDQPADLNQRLEARGMPGSRGGNWLWADLTSLTVSPNVPSNFRIEQVHNDPMMAEWVRISEIGFGSKTNELSCFYDAYARHGYGVDAFSLHYIGYLDDTPVTSGTLLDAGGGATLYDISTLPEYRQQGFGGAITHFMMQALRKRGYHETWIWSSNMAQSLYRSLGFVDADFGLREYHWRK